MNDSNDLPDWLKRLADEVAGRVVPVDDPAPFGCHTNFAEGVWEITVFSDRTEVIGGAEDGKSRPTRFFLDMTTLGECFERVDRLAWQPVAIGQNDDIGPHIAVEGVVEGHTVWLRVLADMPRHFGSGRFAGLYDD